jgi:hypothetical protein
LFLGGSLLVLGYIFNWKWVYPKKARNFDPGIQRLLVLVSGILSIICSILFYIFGWDMLQL